MDNSSTAKMAEYLPDDIVWVKAAAGMWWPAIVQDQKTLDPEVTAGLKKTPLVVVKFLEENYYWTLNSLDPICPYNGERKIEHLEKGFKKYEALKHEKSITMFPTAVEAAEKLCGGNPGIVQEYMAKFKTPDPAARVPKRKRSSHPKQPNFNQGRHPKKEILSSKFLHLVSINPSPPVDPDTDGVSSLQCTYCSDAFPSIQAFLSHVKYSCRIGHPNSGGFFARPSPFGPPLKKKKKTPKVPKPAGNQTKRKSAEKPKVQKRMKVEQDESKKLEVSVEAASILDDWDDEEAEDAENDDPTHVPAAASTPAPASQRHQTPEPPGDDSLAGLSTFCVKGSPTDENHSTLNSTQKTNDSSTSRSAFDFEDDEPQNSLTTFRFGQKLPRLRVPDKSKDRSGDSLLDGDLERLLEETSVPVLPDIPTAGLVRKNADDSGETPPNSSPLKDSSKSSITNEKLFLAEGPLQSRDGQSLKIEGAEGGSIDNCSKNQEEPSISSDKVSIESRVVGKPNRSKRKSTAAVQDSESDDKANKPLAIESQNSVSEKSDIIEAVEESESASIGKTYDSEVKPGPLDSSPASERLTSVPDEPCLTEDDSKVQPEDPSSEKISVNIPQLSEPPKDSHDSSVALPAKKRKLDQQPEEDGSNNSQETGHESSAKPTDDGTSAVAPDELKEDVQPAESPSNAVGPKKGLRSSKKGREDAKELSKSLIGETTDEGKRDTPKRFMPKRVTPKRDSLKEAQEQSDSTERIDAELDTNISGVQPSKSKPRKSEVSEKNENASKFRRVSRRSMKEALPIDSTEEYSSDVQNSIEKNSSEKDDSRIRKSKSKSPGKTLSRHSDVSPTNRSSDKPQPAAVETPSRNKKASKNKGQEEDLASSSKSKGEAQVDTGRRPSKADIVQPTNENTRKSSRSRLGKGQETPAKSFDDVLLETELVSIKSPKTPGRKSKAAEKKRKSSKSEAVSIHSEPDEPINLPQESEHTPPKTSKVEKSEKKKSESVPESSKSKEAKLVSEDSKSESPKRKKSSIPPSPLESPAKNSESNTDDKGKTPIRDKSSGTSKASSAVTLVSSKSKDSNKSIDTEVLNSSPKVKTQSSKKNEAPNDKQTRSAKQDYQNEKQKSHPEKDAGSPKSKDVRLQDKFSLALQDADSIVTGKLMNSRHSKSLSLKDATDHKGKTRSKDASKKLSESPQKPEKVLSSPSKSTYKLQIDEKSPRSSHEKPKLEKLPESPKSKGDELKNSGLKEPKTPSKSADEPSSAKKKRDSDKTKHSSNEDEVKHLLDVLSGKDDSSVGNDLVSGQIYPQIKTPKKSDEPKDKDAANEPSKASGDFGVSARNALGIKNAPGGEEEGIAAAVSPRKVQSREDPSPLTPKNDAAISKDRQAASSAAQVTSRSDGKDGEPEFATPQSSSPRKNNIKRKEEISINKEETVKSLLDSLDRVSSAKESIGSQGISSGSPAKECVLKAKHDRHAVEEKSSSPQKGMRELSDVTKPKDSSKLPSTEDASVPSGVHTGLESPVAESQANDCIRELAIPTTLRTDTTNPSQNVELKNESDVTRQFFDKAQPNDIGPAKRDIKAQLDNAEVSKNLAEPLTIPTTVTSEPLPISALEETTTKVVENSSLKSNEPSVQLSSTEPKKTEAPSLLPAQMETNLSKPIDEAPRSLQSSPKKSGGSTSSPASATKPLEENRNESSSLENSAGAPELKQDEPAASMGPKKVESVLSFTIRTTSLVKRSVHFPPEKLSNSKPRLESKLKSVESDRKLPAPVAISKPAPEKSDSSKITDVNKSPTAPQVTSVSPVRASRWDVRTPPPSSQKSPIKLPNSPNHQSGSRLKLDFNVTGVRYDSSKSGSTLGKALPSTQNKQSSSPSPVSPQKAANVPADQNNGDLSESDDLSAMEADILSYLKGDSVEEKAQPGKTPEKSKIVGLSEAQALAKLLQSDEPPAMSMDVSDIQLPQAPEPSNNASSSDKSTIDEQSRSVSTARAADTSKDASRSESFSNSSIASLSDALIGDQNLRLGGQDFDINSIPIVFEGMFDSEPTIEPAPQEVPSCKPEASSASGTAASSSSTSGPPEPAKNPVRRIVKRTKLMVMPFFCKSGLPDPKKIARVESELLKVVPNSKPFVTYADWLASPVTAPIRQAMAKPESAPNPRNIRTVATPVKDKPAVQQSAVIRIEPKKVALATTRTFTKLDPKTSKIAPVQRTEIVANFPKIVAASSLPNQIVGTRVQTVRTVKSPNMLAIRSGKVTVSPKPAGAVNYIVVPSRGPRFVACTTSQKVVRTKSTESPTTSAAGSSRPTDILAQAMAGTDILPADVSSFSLDVA
ncbi:Hypothetical protein NTJ_06966 [Nesidiocoris tenuis]|uniref:PWWP domain-containing protein n=1 Tax=Nesidiocoris tenuis TaxID=355587 RepID=A0ABN7AS29_9HEMI|nr:Hypothetical protein NTJ_06966 [Nesidiocoris tenuis]